MIYTGIDLAWSKNNLSGLCTLELRKESLVIKEVCTLLSLEDIAKKTSGKIVAVDASLKVNNETGYRDCELELSRDFRKYGCGAYPTNKKILSKIGFRGEDLLKILKQKGYTQDIHSKEKKVIEIYTHSSIVGIFKLKEHLKYKQKPKRTKEYRINELQKLINLLKTKIIGDILNQKIPTKNKELKEFEDKIDSIVCALTAYYFDKYKKTFKIYGEKNGFIVSPHPDK
ncbi:MAG: DUF429 domain-containing protein [Candidatus Woesearchaeota archaeon]